MEGMTKMAMPKPKKGEKRRDYMGRMTREIIAKMPTKDMMMKANEMFDMMNGGTTEKRAKSGGGMSGMGM